MTDAGFDMVAVDSSHCFRSIMSAMSHPGQIHPFLPSISAPAPLFQGAAAILLTLCDFQTPIYLNPDFAQRDVESYLRFHTGAPLTNAPAECSFAVLAAGPVMPHVNTFAQGSHAYPDRSTTLVIQVGQLWARGEVEFTGPGIETAAEVAVDGLDAGFWVALIESHAEFPIGVDVLFVGPESICACPRSTTIRLKECT